MSIRLSTGYAEAGYISPITRKSRRNTHLEIVPTRDEGDHDDNKEGGEERRRLHLTTKVRGLWRLAKQRRTSNPFKRH